jgi:hypothetical protein
MVQGSSMISETTFGTLEAAVRSLNQCIDIQETAMGVLSIALRNAGGGPWPSYPQLTHHLLTKDLLEDNQDNDSLVERAETRMEHLKDGRGGGCGGV